MSLKLNTASGGSITLQEADTASNLTLTVPAQAGSIVTANSSGNVGIGTASPNSTLEVNRNITFSDGDTFAQLVVKSSSGATGKLLNIGVDEAINGSFIQSINRGIDTNNLVLQRYGGNLLVGTTSAGGKGISFYGGSDAYSQWRKTSASGAYIDFQNSGGSGVGSISTNGTNTTYGTSSDYRLKDNIAPMTGALNTIAQLKPCTYVWKSTGEASQGFIAHELQEVVPECVVGEKDAVETYLDEEGVEQTRPKYQGIDTSFLVATLTAAIQELKAVVDAQAERIATLENK